MPKDSTIIVIKDTVFVKDTIYRTEILTIYKDTIQKNELVELYQNILENQSNNYGILITTLIGITVTLLGASWLWNFYYAKKQIHQALSELTDTITNPQIDKQFKKMQQEIVNKFEEEKNKNMNAIVANEQQYTKKMKELEERFEYDINYSKAELARTMALFSGTQKAYLTSITWWIYAIANYHKVDNHIGIQSCVDSILVIINIKDWSNGDKSEFPIKDHIETIKKYVPDALFKEKKIIITTLNKI